MRKLLVFLSLAPTAALAEPVDNSDPVPTFATMDRLDGESKVIPSIGYTDFSGGATQNFDLHAHYVAPQGMGGYLHFSAARASGDGGGDSQTGINNVELGGLYALQGAVPVVFRAGVALPTGDDELTGYLGSLWRTTDFMANFPQTTTLRLSASPILKSGNAFFRADFGVDVPVSSDTMDSDTEDAYVRANVAGGVNVEGVALMGELATIGTTGDADSVSDRFLHTMSFGARYMKGSARPSLSLVVPIDEELRDFMSMSVQAGVEIPLAL